jgi:hypothetical protein
MEMMFSASEKRLIKIMANSESPWDIFVSKPDFKEMLPEVPSRTKYLEEITDLFTDTQNSLIIPIISDIGIGKSHFLWAINEAVFVDYITLFLKVPSANMSFYYSLYTQLIKTMDKETFQNVFHLLTDKWGANKKIYGLFRIGSPEKIAKIIDTAMDEYKDTTENKEELGDCISVIVKYAMDRNKYKICERWLLGDYINFDDLLYIGVKRDLSAPGMAKEMLKLLLQGLKSSIVVMIDDFLNVAKRYDDEIAESNHDSDYDDFDFNNDFNDEDLNGKSNYIILQEIEHDDEDEGDGEKQIPIYERIQELIDEFKGIKLIVTMQLHELEQFLKKIPEDIKPKVNAPFILQPFTRDDFKWFYLESLQEFSRKHMLRNISENPYFPLNENILDSIYDKNEGNPRQMIKKLKTVTEVFLKNIIERFND